MRTVELGGAETFVIEEAVGRAATYRVMLSRDLRGRMPRERARLSAASSLLFSGARD